MGRTKALWRGRKEREEGARYHRMAGCEPHRVRLSLTVALQKIDLSTEENNKEHVFIMKHIMSILLGILPGQMVTLSRVWRSA